MRLNAFCAALGAAFLAVHACRAASYTTDKSYQYTGQSSSESGHGIAVNAADTKLWEVSRSSTTKINILDPTSGTTTATITPVGALVNDIVLSPDETQLYIARALGTGSSADGAIDVAPSAGGTATAVAALGSLGSAALGVAAATVGSDTVLGIATRADFQVWRNTSGTWSRIAQVSLPDSLQRDVVAAGAAGSQQFYVMTYAFDVPSAMKVFSLAGVQQPVTWEDTPSSIGFGYSFLSLTAATVDSTPCLLLAGETTDNDFNTFTTVFRYGLNGTFLGDGFGYGLSETEPLAGLEPVINDATGFDYAPAAAAGSHVYIEGVLPSGAFPNQVQTVRVVVGGTVVTNPGTVNGTVTVNNPPSPLPMPGATVDLNGVDLTTATTSTGAYSFSNVTPASSKKVGAWKLGYAGQSASFVLASGQTVTENLALSTVVPVYQIAVATTPPVIDGIQEASEYFGNGVNMVQLGTDTPPDASIATSVKAGFDANNVYLLISGQEPSPAFNAATASGNDQPSLLTNDDNVQIYLDPPHRHDVPGTTPNLYQFAVNIPPPGGANPVKLERTINADGTLAGDIPTANWTVAVGYAGSGWTVEAKIPMTTLGITPPFAPAASTSWGALIARHRPQNTGSGSGHLDGLPTDYSTSAAQTGNFTFPNTWSDIIFSALPTPVPGDVNGNGILDLQDIALVLRVAGGLAYNTPQSVDIGRARALYAGDVTPKGAKDGQITLTDAVRLARALGGKDTLP